MMGLVGEVRLLASGLSEGENLYTECPNCGRRGKFSILVDNGRAVYHCFRASCELHGGGSVSLDGNRLVYSRQTSQRQQTVHPFTDELEYLDSEWKAFLFRKIGFTDRHLEIGCPMYAPSEHRVAFPIFSPLGRRRGWSLRSYSHAEPKALTRMDIPEPHISWYRTYPVEPSILVVEDAPSAIRAAVYRNTVALMGTGCGPDYAQELAAHARSVVWCLDADAAGIAMKWERKYRLMFEESRVIIPPMDLKDMKEDVLMDFVTEAH